MAEAQLEVMTQRVQQLEGEKAHILHESQVHVNDAFTRGYAKRQDEEVIKDMDLKENLKRGMDEITMEIRMANCSSHIRSFGGDGSEKFQIWLGDLERYLLQLGGADSSRARALALQTLTGPAADFATREIRSNPDITWADLKSRLDARYNDYADVAFARQKLRRMAQSRSESVQNYYERLMVHARHAFGDDQLQDGFVQQQLVEIFLDGLVDDQMVRRLIRSKPETLERALDLSCAEQQARKAFDLRRGHNPNEEAMDPMDISAVTSLGHEETNLLADIKKLVQDLGNE